MFVFTRIGHSTEAPTPCARSSLCRTSISATTPYFATQYGPSPTFGTTPANGGGRGDVASLALRDDALRERLDAVDHAPQVDVDDPAPVIVGHVHDRATHGDARV